MVPIGKVVSKLKLPVKFGNKFLVLKGINDFIKRY